MYHRDQIFVGGKWSAPTSGDVVDVISPHTEAVIGHVACAAPAEVNRAVEAARAAFDHSPWPRLAPRERVEAVARLAALYKEHRAEMAELITAEMGAPITFSKRAQVRLPLTMMSAFCDLATDYDWHEVRAGLYGNDIRIEKRPVGVVAAVARWRWPVPPG